MRAWLRYINEVPSMAIRVPSFQKVFVSRFKAMTETEFESFADANPLRRSFLLKMGPKGFLQTRVRYRDRAARACVTTHRCGAFEEFLPLRRELHSA